MARTTANKTSHENLDLFRDDPQRLIDAWRTQAQTSREQFPNDERRDAYYRKKIEELEQRT